MYKLKNMKKMKLKSIISTVLLSTLFVASGCKDDFADLNTDATKIAEPDILYLFTKGQVDFEPSDYLLWFYNGAYTSKFVQAYASRTLGLSSNFIQMGATGGQGEQVIDVLKIAREIDFLMGNMDEQEAAQYTYIRSALNPLIVYLGLFDSDVYGDRPFTEAAMAKYTTPMLLTPKYDKIESLYDLWLEMLDETIKTLSNDVVVGGLTISQNFDKNQDLIYQANISKWLKLANSMKLKIAVRLVNQNLAKALQIAKEVANSPAGVLDGLDDDMIFNKAISGDGIDDTIYHFGNAVENFGSPNKHIVDFMIKNLDPRVKVFYMKNDYNSTIVKEFLDQGKDIPDYIAANVIYTTNPDGSTSIDWAGPGEPWVRYYGIPLDIDASQRPAEFGDYFDTNRFKLTVGGSEKTYKPVAYFNEELVRGRVEYTVPTLPGTTIEDKDKQPWYGMYMTTAEVNLYFAELKLLGADIPGTAQDYLQKAVEYSVRAYDRVAALNKVPYYGTTYGYDDLEEVIDLKESEVAHILSQPDYNLTGNLADDLEKVYIQQYLHFMYYPTDQFVSVRRSGVPKKNSNLIAWQELAGISENQIPRRMEVSNPSPTDLMFDIITNAMKDQGFTTGNGIDTKLLNSERVWQDKPAPQYGEGPQIN